MRIIVMGIGEERNEMKKVFSNGNISIIYFLIQP